MLSCYLMVLCSVEEKIDQQNFRILLRETREKKHAYRRYKMKNPCPNQSIFRKRCQNVDFVLGCHSAVINSVFPGFLSRIRADGQKRPLSCAIPKLSCLQAFRDLKAHEAKTRLLKDAEFAAFSQPSNLSGLNAERFIANMLQMEGSQVKTPINPTIGSIRRADPFRLAERYGISEDCEHMVELLRFMYQGEVSYFKKDYLDTLAPKLKSAIWSHVRDMLMLAEKYAVDKLFKRCLDWFTEKCLYECGDTAFCESFYQLEHHIERTREPLFREMLRKKVIGLLADRHQFRLVTQDKRWSTLNCSIMKELLSSQTLAISNELEILQLVKRWDAQTDKAKEDVFCLMQTFRPDFAGGYQAVDRMAGNYGFDVDEMFPPHKRFDVMAFAKLPAYLRRKRAAKMRPRCNVEKNDVTILKFPIDESESKFKSQNQLKVLQNLLHDFEKLKNDELKNSIF